MCGRPDPAGLDNAALAENSTKDAATDVPEICTVSIVESRVFRLLEATFPRQCEVAQIRLWQ